jgi:alpha-D-ribose 1-methylphosphonate 5-triphosphate diphosphatase PhnM
MKAIMEYAYAHVNNRDRYVFIRLANESFGQGETKTSYTYKEYWAKEFQITKQEFKARIKSLVKDKHIKINRIKIGSSLCSYSPIVPEYIRENIKLKEKAQ